MKDTGHHQRICICIISLLLLTIFVAAVLERVTLGRAEEAGASGIVLSHESGFYSKPFTLKISARNVDKIYYTIDGSLPEAGAESTLVYQGGIDIASEPEEVAWQIRYQICYSDGTFSEPGSVVFITGENVMERYDIDVLTVWGEPDGLFGYENGIFVRGKLGDEFIADNQEWDFLIKENRMPISGNRGQTGREWEREVVATLFDMTGNVLFSQNCGIRIYGAVSRSKNQPSFRLYARSEYDDNNTFHYPLFEGRYTNDGKLMDQYKRLIVRNAGNDNGFAYIRNEFAQRICQEAGFPDTQSARPVSIYVNGIYYGIYWLMSNYDDRYFRETYGEYEGKMYIYEGKMEKLIIDEDEDDEVYYELAEEYNEKQHIFSTSSLLLEKNWVELNHFIDIENFLQYMAIQNYIGNTDCLNNNFRVYRYYSPTGIYDEEGVFDGRFRFLLFDLDRSLGLEQADRTGADPAAMTLVERLCSDDESTELLSRLLKRSDCQEYYLRYSLSLMNYYFSETHALPVLLEMHQQREKELFKTYEEQLMNHNYLAYEEADYANVIDSMNAIQWYLGNRYIYAMADWREAFGKLETSDFYRLYVTNENEATIGMDYAVFHDRTFEGSYIKSVPLKLAVTPQKGYRFVHWVINGKVYTEPEMEIIAGDFDSEDLHITCVCERDPAAGLEVTALKPGGGQDYIVLSNFGQDNVWLDAYFLSDDESNPVKCGLPHLELKAGECITIYCKNYTGIEALGQPETNFNMKTGETITLSNRNHEIICCLAVPELGTSEGIYKMDPYTGKFKEVLE